VADFAINLPPNLNRFYYIDKFVTTLQNPFWLSEIFLEARFYIFENMFNSRSIVVPLN